MRDIDFLQRQADELGPMIGAFARRLLASPLPWTRMRAVQGLLGLARRHGPERVDRCCGVALEHDMLSLRRLKTMVERDLQPPPSPPSRPPPSARSRRVQPPRPYLHAQRVQVGQLVAVRWVSF